MDPRADVDWTEQLLQESGWVRRLARRLVTDGASADDLVQDTWVAALTRPPSTAGSLRPWLARVLRAQATLRRRARMHRHDRELAAARPEPLPSADELALRSEAHERLVRAVRELREPYRSAILLHYYEELSAAEIARRSGESSATVRSRIHRGLASLREALDADFGDRKRWCLALAPIVTGVTGVTGQPPEDVAPLERGPLAVKVGVAALLAGGGIWLALSLVGPRGAALASAHPDAAEGALSASRAGPDREPEGSQREPVEPLATRSARFVDERTGEPLPDYAVDVRRPDGHTRRASTNLVGELALEPADLPSATGELEFRLVDEPRLRQRKALVHEALVEAPVPVARRPIAADVAEIVVTVPAGPTYELDLDLPLGLALADLHAHLRPSGSPGFDTRKWLMHVAPVREPGWTAVPWVRFAAPETEFLGAGPTWTLELASSDGFWAGRASVDSITGRHAGRVAVALSPQARLRGHVRDDAGPVTEGVLVQLERPDGTPTYRRVDTDLSGEYSLGWLEPGPYRLKIECPRHATAEIALTLAGGVETVQDVELVRAAGSGTVEGLLASRTGSYAGSVIAVLASTEVASRRFFATGGWQQGDEGLVVPLRFDDVPDGRYELSAFALDDQFLWQPGSVEVGVPSSGGGARLECQDDVATAPLAVHALAAESGALLESFELSYAIDDGAPVRLQQVTQAGAASGGAPSFRWRVTFAGTIWALRSGPAQIPRAPRGCRLRWLVWAEGRVPVWGDESAFAASAGDGEARVAEVRLERGWGRQLRVLGRTGPPAELWADGERVAVEREDGRLECRLAAAPQTLELRHGDTRVVLDPGAAPKLVHEVRLPH